MKKVLIIIALNSIAFLEVKSQGFSSIHQTPLLVNPSMAGSTGGSRFAVATNIGQRYGIEAQNNYASFDHLLKKFGIGLGAAIFTYKASDGGSYLADQYNLNREHNLKYQTIGGLISIAPKYVLNGRNGNKKATFSPSLGLSYSQSDVNREIHENSSIQIFNSFKSNNWQPGGDLYSEGLQFNKEVKLSAGGLYNSEKLILGIVLSNLFVEKNFVYYKVYDDPNSKTYDTTDGAKFNIHIVRKDSGYWFARQYEVREPDRNMKTSIQTLDAHFSRIFKFGSSKFSFTPTYYFGIALFRNKVPSERLRFGLYKSNIAFQLNYDRLLLGVGATGKFETNCVFVGYKNDKLKLIASYNTNFNGSVRSQIIELSVNYMFDLKRI